MWASFFVVHRGFVRVFLRGPEPVLANSEQATNARTGPGLHVVVCYPQQTLKDPLSFGFRGLSDAQTKFLRTAQTAACVRSLTPILRRMCCTCSLTVS